MKSIDEENDRDQRVLHHRNVVVAVETILVPVLPVQVHHLVIVPGQLNGKKEDMISDSITICLLNDCLHLLIIIKQNSVFFGKSVKY